MSTVPSIPHGQDDQGFSSSSAPTRDSSNAESNIIDAEIDSQIDNNDSGESEEDNVPECGRSLSSLVFMREFWNIRKMDYVICEDPEEARGMVADLFSDEGGLHGPVTLGRILRKAGVDMLETTSYVPYSIHRRMFPRLGNLSYVQDEGAVSIDWERRNTSLNAIRRSLFQQEVFERVDSTPRDRPHAVIKQPSKEDSTLPSVSPTTFVDARAPMSAFQSQNNISGTSFNNKHDHPSLDRIVTHDQVGATLSLVGDLTKAEEAIHGMKREHEAHVYHNRASAHHGKKQKASFLRKTNGAKLARSSRNASLPQNTLFPDIDTDYCMREGSLSCREGLSLSRSTRTDDEYSAFGHRLLDDTE
ncbi:hypothetical protein C8Q75DRAFT_789125 [Abortiporus biennis]|nr:hypothetical protein C8Q75DRAFT_896254 [Abortiporus biennis]KAI0782024.1 hypothetical protein C8Q75DRAFT_789125 [Abortiporus biennis]